jgi:uncharacterized protein YggE
MIMLTRAPREIYRRSGQRQLDDARSRLVHDTSYRATDGIEVHVRDLKRVGAVIDSAFARAVTDISPIRFKATDLSEAEEAALREATERARRQAAAIAEASAGK